MSACNSTIVISRDRARITNHRPIRHIPRYSGWSSTMGLTRDEVQCTWSRGPKDSIEGVIAHGKMLSVIPHIPNSIPIVIFHHRAFIDAASSCDRLYKLLHHSMTEHLLAT